MMKNATLNWVRLPLEGVENCRELGGYSVKNGQQTNWHKFLRSSDLSKLTSADCSFLDAYGVNQVIDLRSADEIEKTPHPLMTADFCDYTNIPLITGDVSNLVFSQEDFTMAKMYVELLETSEGITPVFKKIAQTEGNILFHCAAGKDRTGVVAMLLLSLVGVSRQDIVSNYEVTFTNIPSLVAAFKTHEHTIKEEYLQSKPESIITAYEHIESKYGSTEAYLIEKGLTTQEINQIIQRFITK